MKRPTGPPASSPTITTTIAAMKPPSDQPKMTRIKPLMLGGPAAPHEESDHRKRAGAAEHAACSRQQPVDVALSLGERAGWRETSVTQTGWNRGVFYFFHFVTLV